MGNNRTNDKDNPPVYGLPLDDSNNSATMVGPNGSPDCSAGHNVAPFPNVPVQVVPPSENFHPTLETYKQGFPEVGGNLVNDFKVPNSLINHKVDMRNISQVTHQDSKVLAGYPMDCDSGFSGSQSPQTNIKAIIKINSARAYQMERQEVEVKTSHVSRSQINENFVASPTTMFCTQGSGQRQIGDSANFSADQYGFQQKVDGSFLSLVNRDNAVTLSNPTFNSKEVADKLNDAMADISEVQQPISSSLTQNLDDDFSGWKVRDRRFSNPVSNVDDWNSSSNDLGVIGSANSWSVPSSFHMVPTPQVQIPNSNHMVQTPQSPVPNSFHMGQMPQVPVPSSFHVVQMPQIPVPSSFHMVQMPQVQVPNSNHMVQTPQSPVPSSFHMIQTPQSPVPSSFHVVQTPQIPVPSSFHMVQMPQVPVPNSNHMVQTPHVPVPNSNHMVQTPQSPVPSSFHMVQTPQVSVPSSFHMVQTPQVPVPSSFHMVQTPQVQVPNSNHMVQTPQSPVPSSFHMVQTQVPVPSSFHMVQTPQVQVPNSNHMVQTPQSPVPSSNHMVQTPQVPVPSSFHMVQTPQVPVPNSNHMVQTPQSPVPSSFCMVQTLQGLMQYNNPKVDERKSSVVSDRSIKYAELDPYRATPSNNAALSGALDNNAAKFLSSQQISLSQLTQDSVKLARITQRTSSSQLQNFYSRTPKIPSLGMGSSYHVDRGNSTNHNHAGQHLLSHNDTAAQGSGGNVFPLRTGVKLSDNNSGHAVAVDKSGRPPNSESTQLPGNFVRPSVASDGFVHNYPLSSHGPSYTAGQPRNQLDQLATIPLGTSLTNVASVYDFSRKSDLDGQPSLKRIAVQPPPSTHWLQRQKIRPLTVHPSTAYTQKTAPIPFRVPVTPHIMQPTVRPSTLYPPSSTAIHASAPALDHIRRKGSDGFLLQPTGRKCFLCKRDLSFTSEGPISQPALLPSVAVLPCGHTFHDQCLTNITPKDQSKDPPCIPCAIGEN